MSGVETSKGASPETMADLFKSNSYAKYYFGTHPLIKQVVAEGKGGNLVVLLFNSKWEVEPAKSAHENVRGAIQIVRGYGDHDTGKASATAALSQLVKDIKSNCQIKTAFKGLRHGTNPRRFEDDRG